MDTWTAVFLLSCFLFTSSVQSAPVGSPSSLSSSLSLEFEETATRAKMLVEKIVKDIPAVHGAAVSIQTSNLQMMEMSLRLPASPVLKKPSDHFTLDMCVSRMSAGVQLYQNLLAALSQNLSGLENLRSDLRDLLTHINKLKEAAQLEGDGSDQNPSLDTVFGFQDSYDVQVGVHFTLMQLESFCHDLIRTFRILNRYRAAGAH